MNPSEFGLPTGTEWYAETAVNSFMTWVVRGLPFVIAASMVGLVFSSVMRRRSVTD